MMRLNDWVKFPTGWIRDGGLRALRWSSGVGSGNTAALMTLMRIAHLSSEVGAAKATYDQICEATGLSRAKVSEGLTILAALGVVERAPKGRSTFQLTNFNPKEGWGKLPLRQLYDRSGRIRAFSEFKLRSAAELNALKLFFLVVAFRDNETNLAHLSYDKFEELAGVDRARIKLALSVLTYSGLIHTERLDSHRFPGATSYAYRLAGLDSYRHAGTIGRIDVFGGLGPKVS